jgi:hypothetical protein
VKKAKRYHEKKNARIQDQRNDIGANAGRTGSMDQMILFAAAQNRRMQERWGAVQASKPARRLRMVIDMRKRKAVDSYFQAIQNKVGKDRSVIMLYGNRSFPPSSKDEDGVPTGSMKRHFFLTRSAKEYGTSRGCPFSQKSDLVPVTAEWKSTGEQYIAGLAQVRCVESRRRSWAGWKAHQGEECKKTSLRQ